MHLHHHSWLFMKNLCKQQQGYLDLAGLTVMITETPHVGKYSCMPSFQKAKGCLVEHCPVVLVVGKLQCWLFVINKWAV